MQIRKRSTRNALPGEILSGNINKIQTPQVQDKAYTGTRGEGTGQNQNDRSNLLRSQKPQPFIKTQQHTVQTTKDGARRVPEVDVKVTRTVRLSGFRCRWLLPINEVNNCQCVIMVLSLTSRRDACMDNTTFISLMLWCWPVTVRPSVN